MHRQALTGEEARDYLLGGGGDAIEVGGVLDLADQKVLPLRGETRVG